MIYGAITVSMNKGVTGNRVGIAPRSRAGAAGIPHRAELGITHYFDH